MIKKCDTGGNACTFSTLTNSVEIKILRKSRKSGEVGKTPQNFDFSEEIINPI